MKTADTLHLVSFDVPYPPDYGGAIDVFNKIKALNQVGVKVILHCFSYGRPVHGKLNEVCEKVFVYKRMAGLSGLVSGLPYIVNSRRNATLLENLCATDAPALFEGIHSCYYLNHPRLANRLRLVRTHNVEHEYYRGLSQATASPLRKLFFRREARLLEKFEKSLKGANHILAISPNDAKHFNDRYGNTVLIPPFHGNQTHEISGGKGDYILFHGNLGVEENNMAALFLCREVFPHLSGPCIIAGKNPGNELRRICSGLPQVELFDGLSHEEISDLVKKAGANLLVTFQNTGIKLKLINALFSGGTCIVNRPMVEGTGLEKLCHVGNTAGDLIALCEGALNNALPESCPEAERKKILEHNFSDRENAGKIKSLLRTR
jgi:hypothetical protein